MDSYVHKKENVKDFLKSAGADETASLRSEPHGTSILNHRFPAVLFLTFCCALLPLASGFGSPSTLKGPDATPIHRKDFHGLETALPKIILLSAVSAFQKFISPTDGDRCDFFPSCSAFGRKAVAEEGVFIGVTMTADRLIRCNPFKRPGLDYLPLADGNLYDPVENNLLFNR